MTAPKISYVIPVDGAKRQGTAKAARVPCAMTAALHSHRYVDILGGELRKTAPVEVIQYFKDYAATEGIPYERMSKWANALEAGMTLEKSCAHSAMFDRTFAGMTLSDYQFKTMCDTTLAGGVHAMGCGLGKTLTAVATVMNAAQYAAVSTHKCWVICPLNAVPAWERMRTTLEGTFDDVKILSMDSAHKYKDLCRYEGGAVIYDEVHLLGNDKARRTKACHELRLAFDFALCLTGTLLHSGIEKIMSIMDLAVPGASRFSDRWAMGRHFNCLIHKQLGARQVTELAKPIDRRRDEFFKYLSGICQILKVDSPDVLRDIGGIGQTIHEVILGCGMDIPTMAAGLAEQYYEEHGEYPHAAWIRMQLMADPDCIDRKVEWLLEQMDDNDLPVVVFDYFTDNLDKIEAALAKEKIPYVRVDGSVTGDARAHCEFLFQQRQARVFLGQTKAASVSMNLQNAYISVTMSPGQSAADYDQSLCRTARRGQTEHCHHFNLSSNHMQSKIYKLLQDGRDFDASASEWQEVNNALSASTASAI